MTAISSIAAPAAAWMITDAVTYVIRGERAGIVTEIAEKALTWPHLKMVAAITGDPDIDAMLQDECERFASFDDVIREFPAAAREMAAAGFFTRIFDDSDDNANHFRIFVAGWSDERNKAETYALSDIGPAPFEFLAMAASQPGLIDAKTALPAMGYRAKDNPLARPDEFLTRLIAYQRPRTLWGKDDGVVPYYGIGGFAMLYRIDATGVTKRRVHEWPNDRVGERIDPTRDANTKHVSLLPPAPPEGLSRLQRDRFQKRQKKLARMAL